MKQLKYLTLMLTMIVVLNACSDDNDDLIDTEKPTVDLSIADAFPVSCDTLYFDEPFTATALFSDNVELAAYNIDIHHNFDQHTHSTEFEECDFDEIKTPSNPYIFIQDYEVPGAAAEYRMEIPMTIPGSDGNELYDEGDYHFQITVVDAEGWSSLTGFNVKMLRR